MLGHQIWSELLLLSRIPAYSVSILVLPVVFFAFFGLTVGARLAPPHGGNAYVLVSFAAFAMSNGMVLVGTSVAAERAAKVDLLLRVTPMPPAVYIVAKATAGILLGLGSLLLLFTFGGIVGGVSEGPAVWAAIVGRLLAGSVPFIAFGLALGYLATPGSATAVTNLVYLPSAFASGLFLPITQMPEAIQRLAPYLPTYHYGQLVWSAIGVRSEGLVVSATWLAGCAALFLALAAWAYRREESLKFR